MRGTMLPLGVAALLMLGALFLAGPVAAKLTLDAKPAAKAGLTPETGGQRVRLPRPSHLECSPFGRAIVGPGLERLGLGSPFASWWWFQRFGWGGPMTPFSEGAAFCVVFP